MTAKYAMRLYEIIAEPLTFHIEHLDYNHGQHDMRLLAKRGNQIVGYIDYSVWRGQPAVKYISVPVEQRRGIGTAMVQQLQAEFPEQEIHMGSLTPDGSKLLGSMPKTVIPNREYGELAARLEQLRAQEAEFNKIADALPRISPTDHPSEQSTELLNQWNAVNTEIWEIEQQLRDLTPSTTLYNTPT